MSSAAKFGPKFVRNSGFGDRNDPHNPARREFHPGIDAVAPAGTEIQSVSGGRVVYSGYNAGLGNVVIVRNADGTGSLYAHMRDRPTLTFSDQIREGDIVGRVGNTGTASKGAHLHFSLLSKKATDAVEEAQRQRNFSGGPLSISLKEFLDGRPTNVLDPASLLDQIPMPRARPDLGDRQNSDQPVAPLADSSQNFNDRFSAIYSPAATPIGDGKGIGSLPDIAATHDGVGRVGNLAPVATPNFLRPAIPFVSKPNGSLVAPGGSALLDSAPMDSGSGPFSTGGRFVPRSSPPQPLYPIGSLVPASNGRANNRQGLLDDRSGNGSSPPAEDAGRFRSPVLREQQRYRQLAAAGAATAPSSAAPNPRSPRAPIGVGNEAGGVTGGVLKWIGNGLISSAEASPLKPLAQGGSIAPNFPGENDGSISDATEVASPSAQDNRRYLSRITSQASAFDTGAPAVPFVPSNESLAPDRPNAFEDRFGSWPSASDLTQPAPPQQASPPLGILTGKPMRLLPPQIFGFPDGSSVRDGPVAGGEFRESQRTGIPMLDEYIRYLNREYPT